MPIFEYQGKKYNVPDNYINDFVKDYPEATTIVEREKKKYRIKSADYTSFLNEFPEDDAQQTKNETPKTQPQQTPQPQLSTQAHVTNEPSNVSQMTDAEKAETNKEYQEREQQAQTQTQEQSTNDTAKADVPKPTFFDDKLNTPWITDVYTSEGTPMTEEDKKAMQGEMANAMLQNRVGNMAFNDKIDNLKDYGANPFIGTREESTYNPETGKIEKAYITPFGNKYADKTTADNETRMLHQTPNATMDYRLFKLEQKLNALKREQSRRTKEVGEEAQQQAKKYGFVGKLIAGDLERNLQMADREKGALQVAIRQTEEAIKDLKEQKDRDQGKDVGFWRGFGRAVDDVRTWDFGLSDVNDAMTLVQFQGMDKKHMTEDEAKAYDEMMGALYEKQLIEQQYGENADFWNRAGVMTGQMPAFMLDFALTGGGFGGIELMSKAGVKVATKAVGKEVIEDIAKQGFKNYVKANGIKGFGKAATNWTIKALGTTADDLLIRAPLMTNTIQFGKTTADIIDRKLGDVVVDKDGNYDFSNDKTLGSAIWQGEANAIIENYSEMFGAHLDPIMTLKNASKLANVIGAKRLSAVLSKADAGALNGIMGNTQKLFEKIGLSDYVGEVTEEYYGQLWRTMLNLDDAYKQNKDGSRTNLLMTGQFHGDIWGGMALSMGLMGAGKYNMSGIQYASLKHNINKADNRAREIIVADDWAKIKELFDLTTNDAVGAFAETFIADNTINDEQKVAALQYMELSLNMRGLNLATLAQERNGEQNTDAQEANESYLSGYNAKNATEMNDVKNALEVQQGKISGIVDEETLVYINDNPMAFINEMRSNNLYSREEQNAIMDYVNAKLTYDGMLQGVRDGIDGEIDQSNAIIDSRVNKTSGMIQSATLKVGDRKVYIILGNVVPYQDGTGIDIAQSDKSIIIRDAETGKLEQIAPFDIYSVDEAQDPEEQRTIAADAIREKLSQEASDKIDGTITLNQGDKYTIPDAQGNLYEITITPNEQGIIDNGDGTVNVWDGEKLLPIPIQDLQSLVDKANFLRAKKAEIQRQAENQSLEEQTTAQTEETKTPTNEMPLPQYEMGKSITIRDDNGNILRGSVEEVDEDGVLLAIENPETGYWNTISYKADDLNSRLVEYDGVEYNTQNNNSPGQEVEEPQVEAPVEITTEDVISDQPGTEQGVSALERIPKDEQGNPIYEMAENADVAWDAIVEQTEGDEAIAQTVADSMLTDKEAELKKAENAKSKGGATIAEKIASEKARQAAIDKAQSEVDFWEQVVGTTKRRKAEAEAEQKRLAEEARKAEEEARLAEEARKAEEEARLAEEARKAEEEARLAEEARKAEEERLKAEQRELDENGRPFVVAPNGTTTFGEITEDTGLISAPIKLSEGYQDEDGKGYGLVHIEANHGEQIRKAGFASVEGFVSFVAKNYDKDNIRVGKRRDNTETTTYLIQVTDEHDNTLFIELSRDGSYWNVNSGGIFRKGYSNKKETVVKTEPQQPNNANSTSSSLSAEDISGISTTEPNGEPTVSTGKGTTKNETDKEVEGELTKTKLQQAKDIMDEYIKTNGKSNMDDINVLKKELTDDELNSLLDYLQNKKKYSIQAVMFKAIISHELGKRRNAENTKEGVEEKIAEAEKEVDTNPTENQKLAGNYKKGHVKIGRFDVTIENPKGSIRSGVDPDGKKWEIKMNNTYGYILGTEGVDGDHIDVYLSDNMQGWEDKPVFVIDQVNPDGSFDEHKVMFGFNTAEEAKQAYMSNYEQGWQGFGEITGVTLEEFENWINSSHRKTKPFAYYKSVKDIMEEVEQQVESSYIEKQWSENDDVEEMKQRLEYLSKATEIGSKEEKEIFPEYEQFEADKKALLEKYNRRVPKEKQDELAIKYKDFLDRRVKLFNEISSLRIAIEEAEEKTSTQAKEQTKQEKLNNIQNSYNGYLKGLSNLVASRLDKALSNKVNINGEVKTIAEFIEEWQKNGSLNVSTRNYKPQINRRRWNRMSGQEQSAWEASHDNLKTAYLVNDYELGKTAYDYANWLLSNKSTQQVQEDKTETKPAIDPNIESLVDKVNKEYEDYYNGVGDFNTYYESKEKLVNILKKLSKEETETIINNLREKGKYTETIKSILGDVNQELKHKNKLKEYFAQAKRLTTGAKEKAKNVAFKLYDYTNKKNNIPQLRGIYHDPDGYAVATDAHIMVALKEKVDKATSGKIIDKDGNEIEGIFPNWKKILRTDGTNVPVNFEALRDFCAGALKECKDAKLSKQDIENKIVFVRFKNGEVMLFFLTQLNKFANAATHIEAKNVNVLNYNNSIIAQSNKGYVLLMPTLQVDESGNLNLDSRFYAYDEQGEKETKQEKKDTKQELKTETKKEVKNKEVTTEPTEKIEDVGEKIGGARKDIAVEFKQRAQEALEKAKDDLEEWIRETPVSKIFNFDLQKLRESGMSNEVISFIKICKQAIPAKPKLNRRLQSWAATTMKVYQMCLQAGTKWNEMKSLIEGSYRNAEFAKMYQAYMAVGGFDSGLELNKATLEQLGEGTYGYKNGERYSLEGKWYVNHAGSYGGIYETKEKAIEALRKYAGENAVPKGKKIEFVVYQRRNDGTCFITPKGKSDIIIQDGFKTSKEATDYRKEHGAELEERYRALMTDTNVELAENRERKGRDYRGGKNVSAQEFMDAFGFRGVEFGNWTNQNDRQNSINETYDALMDLADVLGVSPKALSLNGTLGMAFGARGQGKFNAHYEPDKVVINLTKTRGHGALAHEWFHALDNYFASMVGIKGYATGRNTLIPTNTWIYNRGEQFTYKDERGKELSGEELIKRFEDYGVRKEMAEAWVNLMDKVRQSDYYKRSNNYAILHNSKYWVEPTEIGARAFSKWVENELSKRNATNDYLANNPALFAEELDEIVKEYKPYPFDTDATWMEEAFGNLFSTMEQKTDDNTGKVMLYHKADGTTEVLSDAETALRDALIGTLEEAGIEVVTDNEQAQRVLDMANEGVRLQAKKRALETAFVTSNKAHQPTVVSSADGAKILKELDKLYSDLRFFRTADGKAYGFTVDGKIYIDTTSAKADTPIHEYAHLWASAFRKNNPQEWTNIVELMKGTPEWEEVKKKYPELTTDDEIADEVLAHYSGRRGAERLREEQQKVLDSNADVFEKASAVSAIARVKEALRRFWKGIAEWFNIHFTSAEDVADKVLADMLNGLNPNTAEIDAIIAKAKEDGTYMKAPNGKQSNLSPRQWVQVRTKAFKDWFGDWENDPDNSSKVVDENGEPLVVYHGSGDTITKFVPQERGERYWFSSNREVAESYTPFYNDVVFEEYKREYVDVKYKDGHTERQYYDLGGVHHTYLNVRNPLEIDCNGENWDNIKFEGKIVSTEYLSNYAFENGYDGIIFRNVIDGAFFGLEPSDVYVTFKSSQIKSATDNNGNFDPNNDDIRYQFVGERGAAAMDKAEEASVRLDNLAIAREMEKSGKDAKSVKLATGWERGADGKWRYEVGDGVFDRMGELHPERRRLSNSEQKELDDAFEETMQAFERGSLSYKGEITEYTDMADIYEAGGMERKKAERIRDLEDRERVLRDNPKRLDDYLDNDELFAAYPELRIILVDTSREGEEIFGKMGSYDPWNNTLYLNDTSHSTLVHEVQHAIQRIEGFERGGSPETVRQKIKDLINENKDASDYAKSRLRLYAETKSNEFFLEGPYNSIIKSDNPAVRRYAIEKYWDAMNFIDNAEDSSLVNEYPDLSPDEIALSGYHVKEAVEELKRLAKSYKEDISEGNMNALNLVQKLKRLLQEKNNKELYAALGGEVESRNVEKRLGMPMDERRESLARETEDVSREDQIFLQDGMGVNMSEDGDIRYSKDIDTNRGYTQRENGTYISNRASYAEEQGRFTKGTFAKNYGVSTKAFEVLEKLGVIYSSEWHHTGKNFNKSNFYSWQDDGTMVDGKYISYENGEALEGSVADKYAKNKKEIDKLAKEFENKEWEYKTPKPHLYSIPSFDNYANEQVPYSAYKLTDEEENRRESEHNLISKRGREDEWYLPRERRYDHLAVDEKYREIENERKAQWIEEHRAELEQSYNNEYSKNIDANNKVDAENATIDEYNQQTNGKEKVLERIANILGVSPDLKAISTKEQADIVYNRKMEQERMLDQQVRDEMSKRKEELNKWVEAQIKKGNITTFERVSKNDLPQHSAITKTEMNGKYGWFEASTIYNLPEYYSGYSFKNQSWLDKYNDKRKSANDFYAIRQELSSQYTDANTNTIAESDEVMYRIREGEAPKKTGIGYKVFVLKDGQLYPPMVANPNGEATPFGVWLDADAAPIAGQSKTGRSQVKSGGKGTQGGSGKLAYRPGWHLGKIPYALQFNRQDENGERTLFPKNFVWAEVEYANDVDYQDEAMSYGYNQNGKFQHSLAGLPRVPENGAYTYRTNPNPETDPWIITGAMKVNRLLTPTEVDEMVRKVGREPQVRQEGAITDEEINALNEQIENVKRSTDETIQEINDRFNEELQQQIDGTLPKGHIYQMGMPSKILLSTGVPNLPIEMSATHLEEKSKKENHPFEIAELKNLVKELQSPIAIFKYGNSAKNVIVSIEYKGKQFLIGIHFKQNRNGIEVSSIRGIFPKDNAEWLNWISQGKADYLNKEKIQTLINQQRINLADVEYLDLDSVAKVVKDFENPSIEEEKSSSNPLKMKERVEELAETLNLGNVEIVTNASQLSGKEKRAKGFFNKRTGKITIVLPNNASIADVEQTLLHEAVAHYGLRQMFGAQFDTFLDNVFNNASEEVRRKIVALAAKNGWDFRTATEEYLASLAETTNFEEAQKEGWWQKVKQFFSDILEQLGFAGFKGNAITDNELRYILWRSYENLKNGGAKNNIFNEASDIAKQYELKTGEYANTDNEMMYREGDPERHYQQLARDRYEGRMRNKWYQSKEAFQDSMLSLKEAMQAILGREVRMEDIAGFENAYLGENRLSSVNKAEADAFAHTLFKPMLDEVAKLAPTQAERQVLTEYMMAKHGLERNELMARRDAQKQVREEFGDEFDKVEKASLDDPLDEERLTALGSIKARMKDREEELYFEYRKKDYAGLTALTETENVTDAESTAKFMVDNYEASNDTTELWKRINAVNKATMSKLYECGIIDKATFDNISSMYKFYIPLRGFDEKTSAEAYAYLTHSKSAFNAPYKKAKGRKSKADDPFAYMQSMAESAIAQGNRNKLVKQRFLNFILNHPSDLASVTTIWLQYNEVEKEWQPVFPNNINIDDTAEEVEQKMKDFEDKMTELAEQEPKRYKNGKQAVNVPYRVVEKRDLREHQIIVKRNGVDYIITINGNPRVAQAINGQTNPENDTNGAIGAIFKFGETLNRHLSAFYTTRNPDFVISNFIRDMLYSNSMLWVKETPNYALRFHRNIGRANPVRLKILLAKYRKGKLDENKPIERQFKQFMLNGGETGYSNMRDIEKHKTDIQRELAKSKGKLSARRVFELLAERLDELNRAVENCARFAAFLTSREMGRSMDRAIYDAKEISVNFNKKGSGAKFLKAVGQDKWVGNGSALISGFGRSSFVFWNAAIQGMVNFGRQVKRNPNKAIPGLAALFILGALTAYLGILGSYGDDDDDKNSYYNLPEYVRRSNILFSVGDYWISLPLPIEYRSVYGMGELTISILSGKEHKTGGEIASEIVGQATQLLPIDFLEGGGGLNAFVPSVVKPVWEAYVIEKGWTGMPIYKDNDFNKNMPEWTKAYKSANKYIIGLSEVMNEVSGGDKYTKGAIDFNPAKVEYLLNGYFGGVFSTVDKLVKSGETFVGAREFDPKSFLLMNRVVKTGDERTEYRAVNNEYFRLKEEHDEITRRLRNYERDTDNDIFDFSEKIDFIYNSPEYERWEIFEDYRTEIDALYLEMKYASDEEKKEIEAELNEIKKEMIAEMNETRKRK